MLWLIVTISAYLILAIVFLVDKFLLTGPIPNPKIYTFYIGILGIFVLFIAPFINFYIPTIEQIILSLLAGALFIYGVFWLNKALKNYEPSRVIPAIGGLVPLFTFGWVYIFGKESLSFLESIAFISLVFGTFLITFKKEKFINLKSFQISAITAFIFSLSFVLSKYVYLQQSFWNGFIWIRIGGVLMALGFLLTQEVKKGLFEIKMGFQKRTAGIFLLNQAMGAGANILQNWAIALAPLAFVPIINALQGIQYAVLFIFATFLSLKFPQFLKEEISRKILIQKLFAILLIGLGLALLALR